MAGLLDNRTGEIAATSADTTNMADMSGVNSSLAGISEANVVFSIPDYLVLAVVLLLSSSIGLYYRFSGGKQKTVGEYLLADGTMSVLPVSFSLMASFMSAITLLGVSQENYSFGTQFVLINLAYILSTPVAAYIFLPVFYNLQSASVYRYLEERFGGLTRLVASISFSTQMILYMGIVLYAPSLALSAVTGIDFAGSVLGVGLVCTFYSTLGGMKAVLMTDVFQSILMFVSVFSVVISTCMKASVSEVLQVAYERGRIQFDEISPDPTVRHTIWTQMFGGCFVYCSLYAVNQAQVQRLLTLPTLRKAQQALWIQVPILMTLSLTTSFCGLCIFYTYRDCDPIKAGIIEKSDQLMPLYIVDHLSQFPGLAGLVVSGIFSGSLSTVSSAINSLAAVTLEDYIKPCLTIPEGKVTLILKLLALVYGLMCIALAFLADLLGTGVLQASLTIFGVVGGPLLGLFTLGFLVPRCEQTGAVAGVLTGLALLSWMGFGRPRPFPVKLPVSVANCTQFPLVSADLQANTTVFENKEPEDYFYLYKISYAWYSCIGFFVTVLVGIFVSTIWSKWKGSPPPQVHERLLSSVIVKKNLNSEYRTSDEDWIKVSEEQSRL